MRSIYLSASRARGTIDKQRLLSLLSEHFVVREFNEDEKLSPLNEKDHDLAFTVVLPYYSDDYESDGIVSTGKGGYNDLIKCISNHIPVYVAVNYYHHSRFTWIFIRVSDLKQMEITNENDWKEHFCQIDLRYCEALHVELLSRIYNDVDVTDDRSSWKLKELPESAKSKDSSQNKRLLLLARE